MFGRRKQRFEVQLDAELRDHLERQIADYVASGMSPEEASRQVRLDFGGTGQVKDECRDVQYWQGFALFMQDLRYTLRSGGLRSLLERNQPRTGCRRRERPVAKRSSSKGY